MLWWWFGANMAGLRNMRNTNAFKFILQVFILSQKHILGVKKVVWCGLDVVWGWFVGGLGWFGVFWGGLGCFHGPHRNLTAQDLCCFCGSAVTRTLRKVD